MKQIPFYTKPTSRVFGATAVSAVVHVFGALTCATCWTIFGPALAIGLTYSVYQLVKNRDASAKLPYRMAAVFTMLSVAGWTGSAAYTVLTLVKG